MILAPVYLCLLLVSQLSDVIVFALARGSDWCGRLFYYTSVFIDSLPCSLETKYRLMVGSAWIPTAVLTVILASVAINTIIAWQEKDILHGEKLAEMNRHLPPAEIINVEWPEELKVSSTSATITVDEQKLVDIAGKFENLTAQQMQDLSQSQLLNLALTRYFLGDDAGYRVALEAARAMDPNEPVFADTAR